MKNLVIDIGNTRLKTALFEDGEVLLEMNYEDFGSFLEATKSLQFQQAIISSVTYTKEQLEELLGFSFLFLDKTTVLPMKNKYATPDTLGVDRKAAVIGGRSIIKSGPLLAVDLGSCITYDFLDEGDNYLGGSISPGLQMRFRSMHQQTARLPLAELESGTIPDFMGNSTVSCLRSGVYFGILNEINGFIQKYQEQYHDLKVIICGGDSKIFESLTKDHIFVIPNLILYGLDRILSYNVNYQ
ncbi:type III pantothenate kinase [Aquiflexum lacus]|uniref:type III pantothenate kinase n=1 Tax=Aquiflexum lacus TaxID=2483805 RepID=UPI00189434FF|nr:type III pantothenate kinase [Aquiflexum lacus]